VAYCSECSAKLNSLHMATVSLTQHVYISPLISTLCKPSAAEPGALDLPFEIVARSSVKVPLHHCRELDRLRQKWLARGNDKQALMSSELSDPSRHQRPFSTLSQQEGCSQHKPLVQLHEGSWQSPRGASRHQRSSAEADSPPRRSCSPRCRVARGTIPQTGNSDAAHAYTASHG